MRRLQRSTSHRLGWLARALERSAPRKMASSSFHTALLNSLQRDLPNAEEYSENYLAAAAELLAEYSESTPKKARSLAWGLTRRTHLV